MITKLTGVLTTLHDERARVQAGPLEYELLISEVGRRALAARLGQEVTLHTSHYLEAGAMQSRIVPRLIGFATEAELEFFELFCTVEKIGVKKALKAMARPIREIAEAIQRQDEKYVAKLPGLGAATAEKVVVGLKKKVAKFCLMRADSGGAEPAALPSHEELIVSEAREGLVNIGLSPSEARELVDRALAKGKKFETVEELLYAAYEAR